MMWEIVRYVGAGVAVLAARYFLTNARDTARVAKPPYRVDSLLEWRHTTVRLATWLGFLVLAFAFALAIGRHWMWWLFGGVTLLAIVCLIVGAITEPTTDEDGEPLAPWEPWDWTIPGVDLSEEVRQNLDELREAVRQRDPGGVDAAAETLRSLLSNLPEEWMEPYVISRIMEAGGAGQQALALSAVAVANYPDEPVLREWLEQLLRSEGLGMEADCLSPEVILRRNRRSRRNRRRPGSLWVTTVDDIRQASDSPEEPVVVLLPPSSEMSQPERGRRRSAGKRSRSSRK